MRCSWWMVQVYTLAPAHSMHNVTRTENSVCVFFDACIYVYQWIMAVSIHFEMTFSGSILLFLLFHLLCIDFCYSNIWLSYHWTEALSKDLFELPFDMQPILLRKFSMKWPNKWFLSSMNLLMIWILPFYNDILNVKLLLWVSFGMWFAIDLDFIANLEWMMAKIIFDLHSEPKLGVREYFL